MTVGTEHLIQLIAASREVDEWVVFETRLRRVARAIGDRPLCSAGETRGLGALVFRDSERGRGTGRLWLDADSGDAAQVRALIAAAAERASLALGPAWTLPAPAAPARVVVADPDVLARPASVIDAAVAELNEANRSLATIASARIDVELRSHRVQTSRGFASQFESTAIAFDLSVGAPGGAAGSAGRDDLDLHRGRVRSAAQLSLLHRLGKVTRALAARRAARRVEPGRYDLLLRTGAIAGPGAELEPPAGPAAYGWFAPLVANADAEWVRLGLGRYRPGRPVFAAAGAAAGAGLPAEQRPRAGTSRSAGDSPELRGDPLTLASDGTLDFAPLSAPFSELGEPVRRFHIVRASVAAGLAFDYREAALARTTPNGGVRNLVLEPGPTPVAGLSEPGRRRLLEVDELAWIDVDPRSGAMTAELGLGQARAGSGGGATPVSGGLVTANAFDLLSRARLSSEVGALGWYHGPSAIRIDDVAVA